MKERIETPRGGAVIVKRVGKEWHVYEVGPLRTFKDGDQARRYAVEKALKIGAVSSLARW